MLRKHNKSNIDVNYHTCNNGPTDSNLPKYKESHIDVIYPT